MGILFNAEEVLTMAEDIERRGAEFYRRAAELRSEAEDEAAVVERMRGLAAEEEQHRAVFAAMRRELDAAAREETAFDPDGQAALYLEAMAEGHGGEGAPDATAALTGRESLADLLRIAIGLERKSILFYLGLRDFVPPKLGREQVDAVIAEERRHLATLAADLRAL